MEEVSHIKREFRYFSQWGYTKLDVFEIPSSLNKLFHHEFDSLFEHLKRKGFNNSVIDFAIDYENWSEIEYGNYNLKRITITNFKKISYSESLKSINNYIDFIDKLITGSTNSAPSYFNYFNEIFLPHLTGCDVVLELITETKGNAEVMLSWGGRYEHFKSFIFLCPVSKTIKHLEMGRD